jgi:hypothetical protein
VVERKKPKAEGRWFDSKKLSVSPGPPRPLIETKTEKTPRVLLGSRVVCRNRVTRNSGAEDYEIELSFPSELGWKMRPGCPLRNEPLREPEPQGNNGTVVPFPRLVSMGPPPNTGSVLFDQKITKN